MRLLIFILTSLMTFYCNGQLKNEIIKNDTIITTKYPKTNLRKISKTWKSLDKIQKEWIKVEMDKDGYLIYDPCVGNTETIIFEKSKLLINKRTKNDKYEYEKFTRITGNSSFRLDAYGIENKKGFEVKAKIVDNINGIVMWEFDGVKWLMTPRENYKSFRVVKYNCLEGIAVEELEFLPIGDY